MRAIAIVGIAAFAWAVAVFVSYDVANSQSYEIAQPTPRNEDRALDCRNPRDAAQCRELERGLTNSGRNHQSQVAQTGTFKPSFDCAKATYPDERAICSNAELSQLDNIANAGYEYVRRTNGAQFAKSITLPLLQSRRACGSDAACIKEQQLAAIQKFNSAGAPVSGPQVGQPYSSGKGETFAQQGDRYDVAARKMQLDEWEVSLKAFYSRVAYIGFAYGCKIIKAPAQVALLLEAPYFSFNERAASMVQHGYNYDRFHSEFRSAGRGGFERSQVSGQCDYWNANAQEAVQLRIQASSLMNYIGPADAHPQMPTLFR